MASPQEMADEAQQRRSAALSRLQDITNQTAQFNQGLFNQQQEMMQRQQHEIQAAKDKQSNNWMGSALSGAGIGASFGPVGAAIGGGVGLVGGLLKGAANKEGGLGKLSNWGDTFTQGLKTPFGANDEAFSAVPMGIQGMASYNKSQRTPGPSGASRDGLRVPDALQALDAQRTALNNEPTQYTSKGSFSGPMWGPIEGASTTPPPTETQKYGLGGSKERISGKF